MSNLRDPWVRYALFVLIVMVGMDIWQTVNKGEGSAQRGGAIIARLDDIQEGLKRGDAARERLTLNQDRLFRTLLENGVIKESK